MWFTQFRFHCSLSLSFFLINGDQQLSAYVTIPRSTADTTLRMNSGGDPPTRPGLIDEQRSPEFLDDFWGQNDYYYSQHGIYETRSIRDPVYNSNLPPYYPFPNIYYQNDPNLKYYDYGGRYYRPYYPR
jgi:hypothetical protein